MMHSVAHTVTANHFWTIAAVALIVGYCVVSAALTYQHIIGGRRGGFMARLRQRARLCLQYTGYVGALIARHTVLVTLDALVLNLSLNLLSVIKAMDDHSAADMLLIGSLQVLAGVCIFLIAVIGAITFALCSEIIRQTEENQ